VGRPIPGCTIRIAPDGEVLVKGHMVFQGYWNNQTATKEMIDEDGWLHTGDVMEADEDGFLKIVDRKKELIINAAGKNMSPANIENTIKAACPLVGVVLVVGDARPYNTALIVLDAESAGPYAAQHGLTDDSPETLAAHPDVISEIAAGVAGGNEKLSKVEQIKRFRVLPTFWEPGGDEITLTMKLKRKPIHEKYGAEIEELYAPDIADAVHEPKATSAVQ
jgi:long-subunit acyl-CoA synthetase (AMP-forming)